jgi:phosphatidylserine/phosphatidylglycerophosphate/cardiolipin synthase-like enzyme
MSRRQIFSRSHQASPELSDLMASIFTLELMACSREIYIFSPWITDWPVIRNEHAQIRALTPDVALSDLWLSTVLGLLAERGSTIRIVCRQTQHNDEFLRRLPHEIEVRRRDQLHSKGLLTDQLYLNGSMNFTYQGLNYNDETVEVTSDPATIAKVYLEFSAFWESLP